MDKPIGNPLSDAGKGNGSGVSLTDLVCCVLLVLATLTFWKVYVVGRLTLPTELCFQNSDLLSYFYPKYIYGNEILSQGRFPLWDPYEYCGIPFLASLQPEVFYPFKYLIFLLFSAPVALQVFMLFHLFLSGLFSYIFFRVVQLSKSASFFGCLIWTFSTPIAFDSLYHPIRFSSIAWFPFCLFCLYLVFSKRTLLWSVFLAIGVAMQFLAGVPAFTMAVLSFLLVFYIILVSQAVMSRESGSFKHIYRVHILLIFAAGLCIALVAVQLFPFYEFFSLSHRLVDMRIVAPRSTTLGFALTPSMKIFETFVGVLMFETPIASLAPLAWLGLIVSGRRIKLFFLVGIILLLSIPLIYAIPPFSYNRFPLSWFFFRPFFVAGCSALGLMWLENLDETVNTGRIGSILRESSKKDRIALVMLYAFVVFGLWNWMYRGRKEFLIMLVACLCIIISLFARKKLAKTLAVVFLMILSLVAFVGHAGKHEKDNKLPDTQYEEVINPTLDPLVSSYVEKNPYSRVYSTGLLNLSKHIFGGVHLINGYEASLQLARTARVMEFYAYGFMKSSGSVERWDNFTEKPGFLDLMGAGLLFVPKQKTKLFLRENFRYEVLGNSAEGIGIANKRALPRCFLVHSARIIKDANKIYEKLRDAEIDLSREVVLEEDLPDRIALSRPAEAEPLPRIVTYMPEEVIIEAVPEAGAFLLFHDSYYPGWRAYDDGEEIHIYRANYLFRAVYLSPGRHTVRFSYEPDSFKWGLRLSILGWTFVIGFFLYKAAGTIVQKARKNFVDGAHKNAEY